jgi:hypothetical protein
MDSLNELRRRIAALRERLAEEEKKEEEEEETEEASEDEKQTEEASIEDRIASIEAAMGMNSYEDDFIDEETVEDDDFIEDDDIEDDIIDEIVDEEILEDEILDEEYDATYASERTAYEGDAKDDITQDGVYGGVAATVGKGAENRMIDVTPTRYAQLREAEARLDKVANYLERNGDLKTAFRIDRISDKIKSRRIEIAKALRS